MRTLFKLDDIPVEQRFPLHRDVVENFNIPIGVTCEQPERFDDWVDGCDLGDISLGKCFLGRRSVSRKREHIRRSEDNRIKLIMPLSGAIACEQGANHSLIRPGEFYITDPTQPYEERIVEDMTFVYMLVPRKRLLTVGSSLHRITGSSLNVRSPYGRVTADYIHSLSTVAQLFEAPIAALAAAVAVDLLTATIWEKIGSVGTNATSRRSALFERAHANIDKRLQDPKLDLGSVAVAIGISSRYLSDILREGGINFRQYVLYRRINQCAKKLRDPSLSRLTIEQIAKGSGFSSNTHFSHAFKSIYDMAPRDYRNGSSQ